MQTARIKRFHLQTEYLFDKSWEEYMPRFGGGGGGGSGGGGGGGDATGGSAEALIQWRCFNASF